MPTDQPPPSLDFLNQPPVAAAREQNRPSPDDVLPQQVADALLKLEGVGGAWIERNANGRREVVIHMNHPGPASHIPRQVNGLPTRIVGGEPIRAY